MYVFENERALVPYIKDGSALRFLLWRRWALIGLVLPYVAIFFFRLYAAWYGVSLAVETERVLQFKSTRDVTTYLDMFDKVDVPENIKAIDFSLPIVFERNQGLLRGIRAALGVINTLESLWGSIGLVLILGALYNWKRFRRSSKLLIVGWMFEFLFPYLFWAVPVGHLVFPFEGGGNGQLAQAMLVRILFLGRCLWSLGPMTFTLFPAFRYAVISACTIFPQSIMLNWVLMGIPLLYVPLCTIYLSMGVQLLSNWWFTLSILAFVSGEMLLLVSSKALLRPYSSGAKWWYAVSGKFSLRTVFSVFDQVFLSIFFATDPLIRVLLAGELPPEVVENAVNFIWLPLTKLILSIIIVLSVNQIVFLDLIVAMMVTARSIHLKFPQAKRLFDKQRDDMMKLFGRTPTYFERKYQTREQYEQIRAARKCAPSGGGGEGGGGGGGGGGDSRSSNARPSRSTTARSSEAYSKRQSRGADYNRARSSRGGKSRPGTQHFSDTELREWR